jgi:peptide/nickel transport system substrate-binding protein
LLSGCGQPPPPRGLVFARGGDSVTLDPANASEGESVKVVMNLFEGLVEYQENGTEVQPCLATSWETSDDGLTWRFQLRKGVRFHDGTPLTSKAVVFSFRRQMEVDHPFHQGEFIYWADMFGDVAFVEAEGEYAVVFRLKRPYAPFLSNMAMFTACIVSPAAFLKWGPEAFRHPVGTGPFRFRRWVLGQNIVLERNTDYWRELARLPRLVFTVVGDGTVRQLQAENGSVDLVDQPNPPDLDRAQRHPRLEVVRAVGMNVAYLAMNTLKAPFKDVLVRRAIAHAIDREELARVLYYGAAEAARGMLPPSLWGSNPNSAPPAYDPVAARGLLVKAGFPEGFESELWFMDNPRPYMPQPKAVAEYLGGKLRAVGIRVRLQEFEWATYLHKLQNGEHPMALIGWSGDNGDPDNFLYVLLDKKNARLGSASNYSFYRGEEVHRRLLRAAQVADQATRAQLYREVDVILDREVPVLPLVHTEQLLVKRQAVQDLILHPTGMIFFRKVGMVTP